jgi:WD40 repeat protein
MTSAPAIIRGHAWWIWWPTWRIICTSMALGNTSCQTSTMSRRSPQRWRKSRPGNTQKVPPECTDLVWTDLAFNPNRTTLASAGKDRTIILRDVALRQPIGQPLRDHNNGVSSVSFSPHGTILASGSADRTIILWDISLESWQARACRIANRNLTDGEWRDYLGNEQYRGTCSSQVEEKKSQQ